MTSRCPSANCTQENAVHKIVTFRMAAQAGQPWLAMSNQCQSCGCIWTYGCGSFAKIVLGKFPVIPNPYTKIEYI